MANQIHFYALPALATVDWAHSKAQPFKSQFGNPSKGSLFDPDELIELQLASAALDCGYGTSAVQLGGLVGADWTALQTYLQARLSLLRSTLGMTPTEVTRQAFVSGIEKSELVSLSFLLGCVMCRLATERWAAEVLKAPVENFWHVNVATDAAVSLLLWPTPLKALQPDFVFQAGAHWYTAESKGSFEGVDWDRLRTGLMQASAVGSIGFMDLHNVNPALTLAPIRTATCTMAHFNRQRLRVTHVDPPVREAPAPAPEPVCLAQFAPLVQFEHALIQFDTLPDSAVATPPWGQRAGGFEWRLLSATNTRNPDALWLGAPQPLLDQQRTLMLALALLRELVPLCAIPAALGLNAEGVLTQLAVAVANNDIEQALARARQTIPALTAAEDGWLDEVTADLVAADQANAFADAAMMDGSTKLALLRRLGQCRLRDGGTLAGLADVLKDAARISNAHLALSLRLTPTGNAAAGPQATITTNCGLVVARAG